MSGSHLEEVMDREKDEASEKEAPPEEKKPQDELSVEPVEDRANPTDPGIWP